MKNKLSICAIILLFISSCDGKVKDHYQGTYPSCFQAELDSLLSKPPTTPKFKLAKYYYNDEYVYIKSDYQNVNYFFNPRNEHCWMVCFFNGFIGSDCYGWEDAEFIEIVWEDPR